jgi:hypothetical protein
MTWSNIKSLLSSSLSTYTAKRIALIRRGKYTSGDHYQDGYVAMLYETLNELSSTDDFYPLDIPSTRYTIRTFNKLTGEKVPDVWTN